jgi:P27 family predicted phage terminase small subunit
VSGRPRKPSALKLVAGTDRADRRNGSEPEPPLLNDLAPPAHLSARSAAVWVQLAPMLRTMQVLTVADVLALELLCDAVADYRHARTQLGDEFVTQSANDLNVGTDSFDTRCANKHAMEVTEGSVDVRLE